MTGEDSITCSSIKICPYFRVGYCKYKETCKHFHPKENCGERKCRNKPAIKDTEDPASLETDVNGSTLVSFFIMNKRTPKRMIPQT